MLAYGVVFVLLLGEIDLSIAYVSGDRGRRRRGAPAAGQRPSRCPGSGRSSSRSLVGRRDRRLPGLVRRADRRAVVRRHARRAARLAGRHPARTRRRRPDHHPEPLDQLHRAVLLLEGLRAGSSRRCSASSYVGRRPRRRSRRSAGTASRSATRTASPLKARSRCRSAAFLVVAICNHDRGRAARWAR